MPLAGSQDRPFIYGVTTLSAEHLRLAYHSNFRVDAVELRDFSVYGPRQRPDMAFSIFCSAAINGEPIGVFGDGTQARDFTHVSGGRPLDLRRVGRTHGDVRATCAATEPGRADIEFRAQVRFADGLRGQFEWLLAESERESRALST